MKKNAYSHVFLLSIFFFLLLTNTFASSAQSLFQERLLGISHPDWPCQELVKDFEIHLEGTYFKSPSSNPEFFWKNPLLNSLIITDIVFLDENNVFAAGQFGLVMKSVDGGQTWQVIETPFSNNINQIKVLSAQEYWVAGQNGLVAQTINGGESWEEKSTGTTANLLSFARKDANTMYAGGSARTMIKSTDGGETWSVVTVPVGTLVNPFNKTDWAYMGLAVNDNIIWATIDGAGIPFQVIRSTDQGLTWSTSVATGLDAPGSFTGAGVTAITFNSDFSVGYASFRVGFGGGLIKTTNGGETWQNVANLNQFTPLPAPDVPYSTQTVQIKYDVAISADGNTVITTGLFGQVLASTNGGASWAEIYGGVRQGNRDFFALGLNGIAISPSANAWLTSGSRGVIAGAANFDAAQATVKTGAELHETFIDVAFSSENIGFAVGFQTATRYINASGDVEHLAIGSFYQTHDGGEIWERVDGPGRNDHRWYAIHTAEDEKIWIAGMKLNNGVITGVIKNSADNGQTWTEQFQIAGQEIGYLKGFDGNHLFGATFETVFIATVDGETWTQSTLPGIVTPANRVNSIEVTAPNVVFLGGGTTSAGGKAFILKSTDSGATWQTQFDSGTNNGRISEINFVDARFGFASGLWGPVFTRTTVLYTSDFGQTWTPVTGAFDGLSSAEMVAIAMRDSVNATVFGASGQAVILNGTNNFSPLIPRFSSSNLFSAFMNNANSYYVVGDNSTIVKFQSNQVLNTAPGKFASLLPAWGETLQVTQSGAETTWSVSVDPDGDPVVYDWILLSSDGLQELVRLHTEEENTILITTEMLEGINEGNYLWRVEATDPDGLVSTTYPAPLVIEFSGDQDLFTVAFVIEDALGGSIDDAIITFNGEVLSQGVYIIENVLPGTYDYIVQKTGFISEEGQTSVVDQDVVVSVILTEEQSQGFTVSFVVENVQGIPIADAIVIFNGDALPSGEYTIENVLPGDYYYSVEKPGFIDSQGQVTIIDQDVNVVVVMTEEQVLTYTVTFVIEDIQGNTLNNAVITFNGVVQDEGSYTILSVEPGTYAYSVEKTGFFTVTGNVLVVDADVVETVTLLVDDTNVGEWEGTLLHVYPNPARQGIIIRSKQKISGLYLFDLHGRIVYSEFPQSNSVQLEVSNFFPGVYWLEIIAGDEKLHKKILIQ